HLSCHGRRAVRQDGDPRDRRLPGGLPGHPQLLPRRHLRRVDPVDPAGLLGPLPPCAAQARGGVVMASVPVVTTTIDTDEVRPREAVRTAPRRRGRRRPWPVSVAMHVTLILASVIAIGPVVWVLLSSF